MLRALGFALPLLVALGLAAPASAEARFAVVAGVETYPDAVGAARGANADAQEVARSLTARGYEVTTLADPTAGDVKREVFALAERLNGGGDDTVGVFYFVGHSAQVDGRTYLLGSDARAGDALALSASGLPADFVAQQLGAAASATSVIVLDAGANNAAVERLDLKRGMATFDRPDNAAIIFSSYPGEPAPARRDGVSVFARAFCDLVLGDARRFSDALATFRRQVAANSDGAQRVWVSERLGSDFRLSAEMMSITAPIVSAPSRSVGPPAAAAPAPVEQIHYVDVFFGTDRTLDVSSGEPEFTDMPAPDLTYGVASVSIPPGHERGELESPKWWKFEFSFDPEKHVTYQGATVRSEDEFFAEVGAVVAESEQKQAFVFVHGFNTSFQDAARRTAQLHHDLAFDGAPIFYAWPSEGKLSPFAYNRDQEMADQTVGKLKDFLMMVSSRTGAEKVHIIAHSMGNRALVKALEDVAEDIARSGEPTPFRQIILSAPDVDKNLFLQLADEIATTADRVTLYASKNDQALKISRAWNGGLARIGDTNDGIIVLKEMNTIDASNVRTELFGAGHDYFAADASILGDVRELIERNVDPDGRALERHELRPEEVYWLIQDH